MVGLPATALVAYGVNRSTGEYPGYLHFGLLAVWLIAFIAHVIRYSRMNRPRCRNSGIRVAKSSSIARTAG